MLTRSLSESVANSLHEMPGATFSHSGATRDWIAGKATSVPVSAAIRDASRDHNVGDGRSTSVGQETNASTVGRKALNSSRHSAHSEMCASKAATSLSGSAPSAYTCTNSDWSQFLRPGSELMAALLQVQVPVEVSPARNGCVSCQFPGVHAVVRPL